MLIDDHAHLGVWVCCTTPPSSGLFIKQEPKARLLNFGFSQLMSTELLLNSSLIMTIKTETEKPVLTYSKSRGLVSLVTGMDDDYFWADSFGHLFAFYLNHLFKTVFLSFVAAFMKQRRMGLNDFIQRLATNSYACKQWVPSDSCYCSAFTGRKNIRKQMLKCWLSFSWTNFVA